MDVLPYNQDGPGSYYATVRKDMSNYKGNAGHLMQHWTLCELVDMGIRESVPGLNFIDAHAMAPVANRRIKANNMFDRARVCSPGKRSVYQRAWHQMAPISGYPNSAAFVNQVWTGELSLLLCEIDSETIEALDTWLASDQVQRRCERPKVYAGDWRDRFRKGLPSPSELGLPNGSLTLVSFDPDMYYPQPPDSASARNVYPSDLKLTLAALKEVQDRVIIQLSTYSRGNRNQAPQDAVISSAYSVLTGEGFEPAKIVRLHRSMMSLVYTRNVSWSDKLEALPDRFMEWRGGI